MMWMLPPRALSATAPPGALISSGSSAVPTFLPAPIAVTVVALPEVMSVVVLLSFSTDPAEATMATVPVVAVTSATTISPVVAVRLTVVPLTPATPSTVPTEKPFDSVKVMVLLLLIASVPTAVCASVMLITPAASIARFLSPRMPPAVPVTPAPVIRCRLVTLLGVTSALMVIAPALASPTLSVLTVKLPSSALESSSAAAASVAEPRSVARAAVLDLSRAVPAVMPAFIAILSAVRVMLSVSRAEAAATVNSRPAPVTDTFTVCADASAVLSTPSRKAAGEVIKIFPPLCEVVAARLP